MVSENFTAGVAAYVSCKFAVRRAGSLKLPNVSNVPVYLSGMNR